MNKSIFPNMCTGANLGFGVLGITFSANGDFTAAAICVLLSLLADGMDGRVARALGVSGPFGRELDSLADVVGFGVAPAYMLYARNLQHADLGWGAYVPLLVFAVLGAFRLARFNIKTDEVKGYFQGLPIPAAGCLASTFVLSGLTIPVWVVVIGMILIGYLMVSEVHYPDFKGHGADRTHMAALALVIVLGAIAVFLDWHSIVVLPFALYVIFGLCNTALNRMK